MLIDAHLTTNDDPTTHRYVINLINLPQEELQVLFLSWASNQPYYYKRYEVFDHFAAGVGDGDFLSDILL